MRLQRTEKFIKHKLERVAPEWLVAKIRNFARQWNSRFSSLGTSRYFLDYTDLAEIKNNIKDTFNYEGDLVDIYTSSKFSVRKWHHYFSIYERYFSPYRNKPVRFLEIGVAEGGSLEMWRRYFGIDAIIFGIDIEPECAKFNGDFGQVRIGSQDDEEFLLSVVKEMGGVDIILDDGSHYMNHVRKSLDVLLPQLNDGGIYMIEDMSCAYWPKYKGGYNSRQNIFSYLRDITDDIHHWYHGRKMKLPHLSEHCRSIHIYDSVAVIEKGKLTAPVHSKVGKG